MIAPLIRKAFVMQVHPGMVAEYERRHHQLWPEMEALLRTHGVHHYSIFHHPETNQLFGYVEIESEERWNAIADSTVCQRWWAYMEPIMPSNPDNSPVSLPLHEVFHLQ